MTRSAAHVAHAIVNARKIVVRLWIASVALQAVLVGADGLSVFADVGQGVSGGAPRVRGGGLQLDDEVIDL
jgi:hypothetical protein